MDANRPPRFEVTEITLVTAGQPTAAVDAHLSTRRGIPHDVLSVAVGDLLVYCHDLACVAAAAVAWQSASEFAPSTLPDELPAPGINRHAAGIVLRLTGTPDRRQVNGIPAASSPTGLPVVRVTLGRLTVYAHDHDAINGWAAAWQGALKMAQRLWPDPDAFDLVEQQHRDRIARHGAAALPDARRR